MTQNDGTAYEKSDGAAQTHPHPRPVIVVSRCLGFAACRWNGLMLSDPVVEALEPWVEFRTVCPEFDIGLGAPREPIRLVRGSGSDDIRVIQHETGRDVSEEILRYAADFLSQQADVAGFVLKAKSPSCSLRQCKVYKDLTPGAKVGYAAGLFGQEVLRRFPDVPAEDEGRLSNFILREHFLTRVFTLARFSVVEHNGKMRDLVQFHADHKYLLMAYNQTVLRRLGKITANSDKLLFPDLVALYRKGLAEAMAQPIRFTNAINVLLHMFGYVSDKLSVGEKAYFLDSLEKYRIAKLPLSTLQGILRAWAIRFEEEYLLRQVFFLPYPEALVEITDSGKGRDG